jgi:UDP-glucose 4-epimerase
MLVADARAAQRVLGFKAKWTDLDAIIASAWSWYKKDGKRGH